MELATTRVHLPRSIPYQLQATSLPIASVSATSRKRCRTGSASPQVTTRWLGPGQRAGAGPPAYSRTNAASAQWHAVECSLPPRACDDQRLKFENTGESDAERGSGRPRSTPQTYPRPRCYFALLLSHASISIASIRAKFGAKRLRVTSRHIRPSRVSSASPILSILVRSSGSAASHRSLWSLVNSAVSGGAAAGCTSSECRSYEGKLQRLCGLELLVIIAVCVTSTSRHIRPAAGAPLANSASDDCGGGRMPEGRAAPRRGFVARPGTCVTGQPNAPTHPAVKSQEVV